MVTTVLALVALVLAVIELRKSRETSGLAWAVVVLALAVAWSWFESLR